MITLMWGDVQGDFLLRAEICPELVHYLIRNITLIVCPMVMVSGANMIVS